MWFANGLALASGFNMGTGKGGIFSGIKNMFSRIFGKGGGASAVEGIATESVVAGENVVAPLVTQAPAIGMSIGKMAGTAFGAVTAGILGKMAGDQLSEMAGVKANSGGAWGGICLLYTSDAADE